MSWLTSSWYGQLDPVAAYPLLVLVAIAAGALVGFEREKADKPAGLRTLTLVSLGSALFTMSSQLLEPGSGRIAAQVVTGIGFLGAGAILRGTFGISGMTSAATVWVVAAIGMVIGAGYAAPGFALAVVALLVLGSASRLEHHYLGPCLMRKGEATFETAGGKTIVRLRELLEEHRVPDASRSFGTTPDGKGRLTFSWCSAHRQHRDFLTYLAAMDEIVEMQLE